VEDAATGSFALAVDREEMAIHHTQRGLAGVDGFSFAFSYQISFSFLVRSMLGRYPDAEALHTQGGVAPLLQVGSRRSYQRWQATWLSAPGQGRQQRVEGDELPRVPMCDESAETKCGQAILGEVPSLFKECDKRTAEHATQDTFRDARSMAKRRRIQLRYVSRTRIDHVGDLRARSGRHALCAQSWFLGSMLPGEGSSSGV